MLHVLISTGAEERPEMRHIHPRVALEDALGSSGTIVGVEPCDCDDKDLAKTQWGKGSGPIVLPHVVVRHEGNGPHVFIAAFARRWQAEEFCEELKEATDWDGYKCTKGRFVLE